MSPPDDRVAVPTNGHRRALPDETFDAPSVEADFGALDPPPAPTVPAFTPGQLAAGFGLIAALILLIVGRRRGRRD